MRRLPRETQSDSTSGYYAINIAIPDQELVTEMINFFKDKRHETLNSRVTVEQRLFIEKELHITQSKKEAKEIFNKAKGNGDAHCVVISFNAALPQKTYDEIGVVQFTYIRWTKKAWEKAKEAYGNPIVRKLIECLIGKLLNVSCEVLRMTLGIPF